MSNFKDITGQKFGKWVVLGYDKDSKWNCLCECGTLASVYGKTLRNGTSTSCGCSKTNQEDLTGKKFGKLTVIELANKGTKLRWNCVCECGNHVILDSRELLNHRRTTCGSCYDNISIGDKFGRLTILDICDYKCTCVCDCGTIVHTTKYNLFSGKSKQCNKHRKDDNIEKLKSRYIGKKYGQLTILAFSHYDKHGYHYWKCKCDCGKEKIISGNNLIKGYIKTCGHRDSLPLHNLMGKVINGWTFLKYLGNSKWECRCSCGNVVEVFADNILRGLSKSCGCKKNISEPEHKLLDLVNSFSNYEFLKCRLLGNKEIDIYCDELKLGIEYNGSLFHSSVNSLYMDKPKNYHQQKFIMAKERGIHLINIFDVDYNENKSKIDCYLHDLINPSNRLYARKCEIDKVDKKVAWSFYDKYHLQNHNTFSQINYGLYYEGKLIACMGFGKLRMKGDTRENYYELHRYCVRYGYSVVGGADRLFKCFIKNYNPTYIKSYSDNNYFSGNMYERLGFTYSGQASISYYWYLRGEKLKREQCQVKKLKKLYPDLYNKALGGKEDYIMSSLGACKVYTAGNTIWEFCI